MVMMRWLAGLWLVVAVAAQESAPVATVKEAKALAKQGSGAVPRLKEMLGAGDPKVREEVVRSLCAVGTQYSMDPLILATRQTGSEIQGRAVDCLVNFYYPGYYQSGWSGALKRVGTQVKGKFTDTRDQVVPANVEVRPEVIEAIQRILLQGEDFQTRANAARALGVLRARPALEDLHESLKSKNTDLIYESLVAIRKIGDLASGPRVWFLLRDLEPKVRLEAMEISGLFRNREALPRLIETFESGDKRYQTAALQAIARMPNATVLPMLERYVADPKQPRLRAIAAEGLGRLGEAGNRPRLRQLFESEKEMEPRLAQAFGAVRLGDLDEGDFAPLRYLVNTLNSAGYSGIASAYLTELAEDGALRRLLGNWIPNLNLTEKLAIAKVLGARGEADSLAPLEYLSKDADSAVVKEAMRALQQVRARIP